MQRPPTDPVSVESCSSSARAGRCGRAGERRAVLCRGTEVYPRNRTGTDPAEVFRTEARGAGGPQNQTIHRLSVCCRAPSSRKYLGGINPQPDLSRTRRAGSLVARRPLLVVPIVRRARSTMSKFNSLTCIDILSGRPSGTRGLKFGHRLVDHRANPPIAARVGFSLPR